VAHGRDRARRHRRHRLPARERHRRRVVLHGAPQRVLGELLERLALPGAVPALDQPRLHVRHDVGQRDLKSLPAARQRARDHRRERYAGQPFTRRLGLEHPGVVQPDRLVAGERAVGVAGGPAVPEQENRRHRRRAYFAASAPVASAPISTTPSPTRYHTNVTIEWCGTYFSNQAIETYATPKLITMP